MFGFETRDREFTAQILKRDIYYRWRVCGHTTVVLHEPVISAKLFDEDAYVFNRRWRTQLLYNARITEPKIKFGPLA